MSGIQKRGRTGSPATPVRTGAFLTSWVFSRKEEICVAMMYTNVTKAAGEAMDDVACEIYRNAKGESGYV